MFVQAKTPAAFLRLLSITALLSYKTHKKGEVVSKEW